MRTVRPENYSDSAERSAYRLTGSALEQRLDTITARNQTHDFEIFCRKLCERVICPNLKPATGPEGGGDSKADTETIAVADEIASLGYVGDANAARERWAFAFSAKKTWKTKARSDIDGLAATGRPYAKVFFVTSQFAKARDRAALEDELSTKHGFRVEILDRSWILAKVIDGDNVDLAVDHLGVGERVHTHQAGDRDYARGRRLEALEKTLQDPQAYGDARLERVADALDAAMLSRALEKPRYETDGRFERAVRLADADGLTSHRIEARYERLRTAFYWFDDLDLYDCDYDEFASLALPSNSAHTLGLLSALTQNLYVMVMHKLRSPQQVKLQVRVAALRERLVALTQEPERPNSALEAETSLLVLAAHEAMVASEDGAISQLWPKFSSILKRAEGLTEYTADQLTPLAEAFGQVAGNDKSYNRLVEDLAHFVGQRKSEGESGKILLKRALQLDIEQDRFDVIRLLGRAVRQLCKREYVEELVEATYTLAVAYRGAGMLWAARSAILFTVGSIIAEAEAGSDVPASIVPALMLLAWIDCELRHLAEFLEVVRLVRAFRQALPLDEPSKARADERLEEFDLVLACQFMRFSDAELSAVSRLPDLLGGLRLNHAQSALLFALGHEGQVLGTDADDPNAVTAMEDFFARLADQPAADLKGRPLIIYEEGRQSIETIVLGMRIVISFDGAASGVVAAEVLASVLEVFFATTLVARAGAHAERFDVMVEEIDGLTEPDVELDVLKMRAILKWPRGAMAGSFALNDATHAAMSLLVGLVFSNTCIAADPHSLIEQLYTEEALGERTSGAIASANSRNRVFGEPISRMEDWWALGGENYPPKSARPKPGPFSWSPDRGANAEDPFAAPTSHRDLAVRSIIDLPLWERAGWSGMFFMRLEQGMPPAIGMIFDNEAVATAIFDRWRERFGKRDTHDEIHFALITHLPDSPGSHYAAMLTSGAPPLFDGRLVQLPMRLKVMEPPTDENLRGFRAAYDLVGCYFLVAAVLDAEGTPRPVRDASILKRNLQVKRFADIGDQDLEAIARPLILRDLA